MKLPAFEYAAPATLAEAIALLAGRSSDARPIAGGQSLLPTMAFRLASPGLLVDLRRLSDLARIDIAEHGVTLGARVRWCDIESHAALPTAHPLLRAAIRHVAHYQIRNRGTVGGSLAHADPAAELPGIAVACDAEVVVEGPHGRRTIAAADFFLGPLATALDRAELIVALRLPPWRPGRRWAFEELALRRGDFALAGLAVYFDIDAAGCATNTHIAVIGACHRPHRIAPAEAALDGRAPGAAVIARACELAAASVEPPTDLHASAAYRRSLVGTLLERALARAAA